MRIAGLIAAVLIAAVGPVEAQGRPRGRLGVAVAPVRLIPTTREPVEVGGASAYFGEIRLEAAADGIVVIDRLSMERYLLGLEEVPLRWPREALRAQAIAARTYALWTLGRPPAGAAATYGFDICASVECQVFAGADVVAATDGDRWQRAVEETAGRVVLYDGEPILARYHSTSGGRTFDNEQIFPSEGAYPYLVGVRSTTEASSPLYRWTVYIRLGHLRRMLGAVGVWDRGRITTVRTIPSRTGDHYPDVVLRGSGGRVVMTAEELRSVLGEMAPSLYPDLYPSPWTTASGRLPETLPSNRYDGRTSGTMAVFEGRGWGHGVGLSQWGAYGMARAGATHEAILRHYYTGVDIGSADTGRPVDVGIDWGRSEVIATGAYRLVDGRGRVLRDEAIGEWSFSFLGPGRIAITPPDGSRGPLRVRITGPVPEVSPGTSVPIGIALSRPARVVAVVDGAVGGPEAIRDRGRGRVEWRAPERPGDYRIAVRAAVGGRTEVSDEVTVSVEAPAGAGDPAPPARDGSGTRILLLVSAMIVLVGALAAGRIKR